MTMIVKQDGPLGFLTKPAEMSATDHPNRTKYFKSGAVPPADLILPLGKLCAFQIVKNAEGASADSGLIMPDTALQTWTTPIYVCTHPGQRAEFIVRGDLVAIRPQIQFEVIRVDGWELLICHEEQCQSILPTKNVLGTRGGGDAIAGRAKVG